MKKILFTLFSACLVSYSTAQNISGCMDSTAYNFNDNATIDDFSCYYFCENSDDDIINYNCESSAHPVIDSYVVSEFGISDALHINNPIGICYQQNPPSSGPHRSMWGKWGEYEYMPPQRYLHNLEHGGIVLLYHPCVNNNMVDSLRNLACSRPSDDTGEFRYILSPYPNLESNIAVLSWGKTYINNDFNHESINEFIDNFYRTAPEDFGFDGTYDNLFIGRCLSSGCKDSLALNFDYNAQLDNNSCIYSYDDSLHHDSEHHGEEVNTSIDEIQNQIDSIMTIYPNCTDYPMNILIELDSLFQILSLIESTDEQVVTHTDENNIIEDAALFNYLDTNYPGIFINGSIDTTVSNQINSLNLDNLGISSIEGLENFQNLETLYVNNNQLTELHGLPESLVHLSCRSNNLTDLHHFTENMLYLDARGNDITDVIGIPNQIESLKLCFNDLTQIQFPDSLKYFLCASNNLQSLPEFPSNLIQVLVHNNNISSIPEIPESLTTLIIHNNNLTHLPDIPETLTSLGITNNPIECVNSFPTSLQSLLESYQSCSELRYNQIIEAFQVWYLSISLPAGWNLIGYTCPEPISVSTLLEPNLEKVNIVKDNQGNAFLPEWNFNAIGEFQPGLGYQVKLNDSIIDFSTCNWYETPLPNFENY